MKDNSLSKSPKSYRFIRIILRIFLVLIAFLFSLILALNIPAVQTYIAQKIINSIRTKAGTAISIGSVKISIPNSVFFGDIYIEDQHADTLLYLHSLKADINLFKLLNNEIYVDSLDFENLVANIQRKDSISGFNFQFIIDAVSSPDTDTAVSPSAQWFIYANELSLKNIRVKYADGVSGTDVRIELDNFESTIKEFDIEKRRLAIDRLILKNTSLNMTSASAGNEEVLPTNTDSIFVSESGKVVTIADIFPDWSFSITGLSFNDINFKYNDLSFPQLTEGFDSRHIDVSKLYAGISNIGISNEGIKADINSLSFNEQSGFSLDSMSVITQLSEQSAELKNLQFESSLSKISGDASLSYSKFDDMFSDLGNCNLKLDLKNSNVNIQDVLLFNPALLDNGLSAQFKNTNVSLIIKANGKINKLNVENVDISLLEETRLKGSAKFSGLPEIGQLGFDAQIELFSSVRSDINRFIDTKSFAELNLPPSIEISGTLKGKTDLLFADVQLISDRGTVTAGAFYHRQNEKSDTVNVEFTAKNILIGLLLNDTIYGKADFSGKAAIARTNDGPYAGTATLMIEEFGYNSYDYKEIGVKAKLNGNLVSAEISSDDPNFNFGLTANGDLSNEKKKFTAALKLSLLNLHALNFTQNEIGISTDLNTELSYGGIENSEVNLSLTNTKFFNKQKEREVKLVDLKATSSSQGIDLTAKSDVFDGSLNSNITIENIAETFRTAFGKYFYEEDTGNVQPGKNLTFHVNVHEQNDILSLFNPKLNLLEINKLEGSYSSDNNRLKFELQLPQIDYSDLKFDTLKVIMDGEGGKLSFNLNCDKVSYKNFLIRNVSINEKADRGKITSEINTSDSLDVIKYSFINELEFGKDNFKIRFMPGGLILNGTTWVVDQDNLFNFKKDPADNKPSVYSFQNFNFQNDEEFFGINTVNGSQNIVFRNFALQDIFNIAEFKSNELEFINGSKLLRGKLDGDISFPLFPDFRNIDANLAIDKLFIMDSLVGKISFIIKAFEDKLNIEAGLNSDESNFEISGSIDKISQTPVFDLNALININDIKRFESLSFGTLSEMSGKVNGKISLTGSTEKPVVNGKFEFNETVFKVNSLNFLAKLNHEVVLIDNEGLHFDNFSIEDINKSKLVINGDIIRNDWKNLGFNLNVKSKGFQPMNSTAEDNPVLFGKLSLGTDVNITGDMNNPKVDANIVLETATNLTYVLPGSELKLVTSEGIVEFQDSTLYADSVLIAQGAPDYITDSVMSRIKGFDLMAHVELDPGVKFTVDIDPNSGDYLTVEGFAKLDIISNSKGQQSVNGMYEVSSGIYQLSFYDLVKKDFLIKPGSSISWSGRPMDADMNITAVYVVRTTSIALLANESTTMSEEEKKIFNKRLPYEVKLNIKGFLSKPEISFNITLPSQYLSDNPLIDVKLRQLNMPEMEAQLNKQVFALLVAGSFIAESPVDNGGSSNIATTAARNSVNGILASQLNNMSGKYISGVDVNFGLTSYDDYSSGSNDMRTEMDIQVSKKLFNDRITIEAENSFGLNGTKKETTDSKTAQGYGQFSVIYSLTKNGEYKLRAYYQNAYDPFDGDISYSGLSVLFEKELDRFLSRKKPVAGITDEETK